MTEVLLSIYQFARNMKGLKLIVFFGWDDENRYGSMIKYFFCNTSHDYIFQPFPAVSTHNNNICMQIFSSL